MVLDFAGIQWLAVVVTAVAGFVIGGLLLFLFRASLQEALGETDAEMREMRPDIGTLFILVGTFVQALALALIFKAAGVDGVGEAIVAALVVGVGFRVLWLAISNMTEGKKGSLTIIQGSTSLIVIVAQGIILSVWA